MKKGLEIFQNIKQKTKKYFKKRQIIYTEIFIKRNQVSMYMLYPLC